MKKKIQIFHALLAKLDLMPHKADILAGEGIESTKELTEKQLDSLILVLQNRALIQDKRLKERRSAVLKLATNVGIKHPDNFDKFNNWMLKYSLYKKPPNKYSYSELAKLIKQLQGYKQNSPCQRVTYAFWGKMGEA